MKKLVIVAIAIINCFVSLAQSRVEPVEFQKIPRQAAVIVNTIKYNEEKLLLQRLNKMGILFLKPSAMLAIKSLYLQIIVLEIMDLP